MFRGRVESWNLRDTHMIETLDALLRAHLAGTRAGASRRLGAQLAPRRRARHRDGRAGELNLGQLVRERYGDRRRLIGFTTHTGTVTAAATGTSRRNASGCGRRSTGSYERLFHEVGLAQFLLRLRRRDVRAALLPPRLERAIGVIYRPETERISHYFRRGCPSSSTPSCTSTRPARSSRWRRGASTRRPISPRRIRRECDGSGEAGSA